MILRLLILVLVLGSNLTSPLFAACARGESLIAEVGGLAAAAIPGIGTLDSSDFFALMGPDNAAPIGSNVSVQFPQNGSSTGVIARLGTSATMFLLPAVGTYLVEFQVDVTQAAQLALRLNGAIIANSVVGRATGSSQIVGVSLVTTITPNSILEVFNPAGNSVLALPVNDGGTHPVSAHLVITRIN